MISYMYFMVSLLTSLKLITLSYTDESLYHTMLTKECGAIPETLQHIVILHVPCTIHEI